MVNDIREYRGRSLDTKEWITGFYVHDVEWAKHWIYHQVKGPVYYQLGRTEVDGDTVGQWTGKVDRNNSKIYNGDMLFDEGDKYLVVWNEAEAGYELNRYGQDMYFNEGGGEEWTNDERDLGYSGVDMSSCDQLELIKEADDK